MTQSSEGAYLMLRRTRQAAMVVLAGGLLLLLPLATPVQAQSGPSGENQGEQKSGDKDAAWLFVQWATSPYVVEQVSLQTLASPRLSTWADPAYQAKLPAGFGEAVGQSLAIAQPSIMYLSSADEVIQSMVDALQGAYQGTPFDEAMQTLQDQATTVVKDAGLYKQ